MKDFTLIIPTYNRPRHLKALLGFLEETAPGVKLLVLDSSDEKDAGLAALAPTLRFPPDIHPFDKFLAAVKKVRTSYCMLLADDDVVLRGGLEACVIALRHNPDAVCARGCQFMFDPDGTISPGAIMPPAIDQPTALERMARMMHHFYGAIYSVYRVDDLHRALAGAEKMRTFLGKELMTSALAAVAGPILAVNVVLFGRSSGQSHTYVDWHPVDFFLNNADGLGAEYAAYRKQLAAAINEQQELPEGAALRGVDAAHYRYLVQHSPLDVLDYLVKCRTEGCAFDLAPELQESLLNAVLLPNSIGLGDEGKRLVSERMAPYFKRWNEL